MNSYIEILSTLFRDIEHDLGTRDLNNLTLKAFETTVKQSKMKTLEEFCEKFKELLRSIKSTQPRFSIIIEHFYKLHEYIYNFSKKHPDMPWQDAKQKLIAHINELSKEDRREKKHLLEQTKKIDVEGKTILIFDHSHTVQDALGLLWKDGQKFKVIVAEQDIEKTETIIEALESNGIPFQVVPSYMLSHLDEQIDILFFGAVTFKNDYNFVMDPGSAPIIAEFHLNKKPTYMFMTTSKFALWKSQPRHGVFAHKHRRKHTKKSIFFERLKFSHDRVSLDFFTHIVTEAGIITPNQFKKIYDEKYEERTKWREIFFEKEAE